MKKTTLILCVFLGAVFACQAQEKTVENSSYNLSFEVINGGFPAGWKKTGNAICEFSIDSIVKVNGKYATAIEVKSNQQGFGALGMTIPHSYSGKTITLSGYMKTENVAGSHAGLWMRLDPKAGFDNMAEQAVKGTTDWKKYTITLPLVPNKVQTIVVGGILVGSGKIWIDNLEVLVDGVSIDSLKPIIVPKLAADNDNIFAAQSHLTTEVISHLTNKELVNLGLIWGYLKYYHPNIQKGQYNWDAELFRIIHRLGSINSSEEREDLLVDWIHNLGEYQNTTYDTVVKDVTIYPDLDWIKDSGFSKKISSELLRLKDAKREDEGYYIEFTKGVGNPTFPNEHSPHEPYPDAGYRLLALYRYWNIIQYFCPNRHLIGMDWKKVLAEYIPKVVYTKDGEEYALAMLEVIDHLNDSHATLAAIGEQLDKYRGTRLATERVSFIEKRPIVTGYYNDSLKVLSPLQIGDEIISVDGKKVTQFIKERWGKSPASNMPGKLLKIAAGLLQSNKEEISISYKRGQNVNRDVIATYSPGDVSKLFSFKESIDTCFRMLSDSIAYIHIATLKSASLPNIISKVRDTKGLIVDFRCYPSDYNSPYILASYLSSKPVNFVKSSIGSVVTPGLFVLHDVGKFGEPNPNSYKGKTIVLVNEKTMSAAEFATMLFRAIDNVTIIGSTTAGADGDISQIYLPGGLVTNFSGIGIYYPDGGETQGVGIVPDIKIEPTIKGIRNGKDEVLDRALKHISQNDVVTKVD